MGRWLLPQGEPFEFSWRGMKIWVDPEQSIDMRVYSTGDYEPETLAAIAKLAHEAKDVIDIGANIGMIAMWSSQCVGPQGRVIAVEPSSWACERIRRNTELSSIGNVEVLRAAVSDQSAQGELETINGYRVDNTDTRRLEQVRFATVDEIIAEYGVEKLSLLKVDTDGFEWGVFQGAHKTLTTLKPNIVFEYGPDHLRRFSQVEPSRLIELLESYGYKILTEQFESFNAEQLSLGKNQTTNLVALHSG
ncbi:MAG: FkbM family methyltransferase [Pseudomonadota bacterium]